jgi:hypothetical protein
MGPEEAVGLVQQAAIQYGRAGPWFRIQGGVA